MLVELASLELNWLRRRHDKSIPLPRVAIDDSLLYTGLYCWPCAEEHPVDGELVPLDRGLIVLSTAWIHSDAEAGAALAHEWRHHQQFHAGWRLGEMAAWNPDGEGYETAIYRYFTENPKETDALLFEMAASPAPHHEYYMDIIRGEWT